jgi:hypothetical protein
LLKQQQINGYGLDAAQTREAVWLQLHQNFVQRGWLAASAV